MKGTKNSAKVTLQNANVTSSNLPTQNVMDMENEANSVKNLSNNKIKHRGYHR